MLTAILRVFASTGPCILNRGNVMENEPKIITDLPLPLSFEFPDVYLNLSDAVTEERKQAIRSLEDFSEQEGNLYLGNLKIGKVVVTKEKERTVLQITRLFIETEAVKEINLPVEIELGLVNISYQEYCSLLHGSELSLKKQITEPVDILVNGFRFGKGEIVVVAENYGIRISEIIPEDQRRILWKKSRTEITENLELTVSAHLGKTFIKLKDLADLPSGSILKMEKLINEPCDLFINDTFCLKADVTVSDDLLYLKIITVNDPVSRVTIAPDQELKHNSPKLPDGLENIPESGTAPPFSWLQAIDADWISGCLNEHPQIMALILSYLEPEQASRVLMRLPQEIQARVIKGIAALTRIAPGIVNEIEVVFRKKIESQNIPAHGGLKQAMQILKKIDRVNERLIIEELEEEVPELAEQMRNTFAFNDLALLDGMTIQAFLRDVDTADLAKALQDTAPSVKTAIFNNLSAKAAAILTDEMEYHQSIRPSDVQEARQKIIGIIQKLSESGRIVI